MASHANPNPTSFDMQNHFNPSTPSPAQNFINNTVPTPNLTPSPFPSPSASYPPPLNSHSDHHPDYNHLLPPPTSPQQPHFRNSPNSLSPNHHGARLMALLNRSPCSPEIPSPIPCHSASSTGSDAPVPQYVMRIPTCNIPKGRRLIGDCLVYDVDDRFHGEVQPQLEVTPITKYNSDPRLILGRQIAVNKSYICYGLKSGAIRVLNINTASRSLLKGLAQKVTDMAFFGEDVHLLASTSVDGRIWVWKIIENPDEGGKPQISGRTLIAIQVTGEGKSVCPRVCWHCHKQEVLVVGIGRHVLKIDTTQVGKGEKFSVEEPIKCHIEKLIGGFQLVGSHDGEVTDLSMSQCMTSRLVSASLDGTIKIWEDNKLQPIAVLQPHDGHPVNFATFLAAPNQPDHIILITGGPLNREVKIWVSASNKGRLHPSDTETWHYTQKLELKSSKSHVEEAFFNQVAALPQAGLLLLANAKRNCIYAVHLEYGSNPMSSHMDYMAEFAVTMPILSFTGTSHILPSGEQIVQVYCVQTQAIQQYALHLLQCLPPVMENVIYDNSETSLSLVAGAKKLFDMNCSSNKQVERFVSSSTPKASIQDSGSSTMRYPVIYASTESPKTEEFTSLSELNNDSYVSSAAAPPLPLSPRRTLPSSSSSDHGSSVSGCASSVDYSVLSQRDVVHRNISGAVSFDNDSRNDDNELSQDDCKNPTHLVTPAEILITNSASSVSHLNELKIFEPKFQDVLIRNDTGNIDVEEKVLDDTRCNQNNHIKCHEEHRNFVSESKEKSLSEETDLAFGMARECRASSSATSITEDTRQFSGTDETRTVSRRSTAAEVPEPVKDVPGKIIDPSIAIPAQEPVPNANGKEKSARGSSSPLPSALNSMDAFNKPCARTNIAIGSGHAPQISSMQSTLYQLVTMQKDMKKQMADMIGFSVTKESRRLEATWMHNMKKSVEANVDALWVRFQEENMKQDKAAWERIQQLTDMVCSCLSKELPSIIEKTVQKEMTALWQSAARTVEKTIFTSIAESFQKGIGDKATSKLEKSVNTKLEVTVARQIQTQFQTSGKQVLRETLKSSLEASVIPAFEMSCRSMFKQINTTFRKGMADHTSAAQQQFEASHTPLAIALRDAINSATSMNQTLSSEILDGQRKLLSLAASGANSNTANALVTQPSNAYLSPLQLEAPVDPTKEISRLIAEHKYEEAFTAVLQRSDVTIVSWLCSQVDLPGIMSMNPLPLSQGVLLSLLQQLACDIGKDTPPKLAWMRDVISVINPTDSLIIMHVRPILEQVCRILDHHHSLPTTSGAELSNIRLIMHCIHSILITSK